MKNKITRSRFAALRLAALPLLLATSSSLFADPFAYGDVFAAVGNGNVNHYSSAGVFKATYNIGAGGFTTGMAFDGGGNLYVTGFSANTVAKFEPTNGGLVSSNFTSGGLSTPESIVFDQAGNMFVGNVGSGIKKFTSAGASVGTVIGTRVDFFDLSADQSKFIYGTEGNFIGTVTNALPGTTGTFVASGVGNAFAMRYLPDGGVLVASESNVKRYSAAGALLQTYDVAGQDSWFALNLDPDGASFWSGNFVSGLAYKFNIAAGGAPLATLNTGAATRNFFGLAIYGEATQGGPPPPPPPPTGVPDAGSSVWLLGLALSAVVFARRKLI